MAALIRTCLSGSMHCRSASSYQYILNTVKSSSEAVRDRDTLRIINSRCDDAAQQCAGCQVEKVQFRLLLWNAGFRRWTFHTTAQTWQQVILYSDTWRNVYVNIDFRVMQTFTQMLYHTTGSAGCQMLHGRNLITPSKVEQVHRTQGDCVVKITKCLAVLYRIQTGSLKETKTTT